MTKKLKGLVLLELIQLVECTVIVAAPLVRVQLVECTAIVAELLVTLEQRIVVLARLVAELGFVAALVHVAVIVRVLFETISSANENKDFYVIASVLE